MLTDTRDQPITAGDRVERVGDPTDGAPAWARLGTVVGVGRERPRVRWDWTEPTGLHCPSRVPPPQAPPARNVRKIAEEA